jgi:hypothetical protein
MHSMNIKMLIPIFASSTLKTEAATYPERSVTVYKLLCVTLHKTVAWQPLRHLIRRLTSSHYEVIPNQQEAGPYLHTCHRGPGPGPGRHIKKNRYWSMVCWKKRLSKREKFKGDLYWKQCWYHSGTEFSRYGATGARRSWGYCLLAASVISVVW